MKRAILLSVLLVGATGGTALASPIVTFSGAPSGLTFTVESIELAPTDLDTGDSIADTYRITLQLTTSGYVGSGHILNSLALDVGSTLDAAYLVSYPANTDWALAALNVGVNSAGPCGSPSVAGSACADETASLGDNLLLTANGTYQWVFDIDLGAGGFGSTTELQFGIATLKTTGSSANPDYSWQKVNTYGPLVAAVSLTPPTPTPTPSTPPSVPEPATIALLGAGLAGLWVRRRRTA